MPFDPDELDPDDPWEIDDGNRPHLFKHDHYSQADLDDIYFDSVFFPAHPPADWLMVGEPPGEPPLVVPLCKPKSGDPTKARPIGIYQATGPLLIDYLRETGRLPKTEKRR